MCTRGTYRGRRNPADGVDSVYLVRDETTDLPEVHPRDVYSRAAARRIRQGPSDENSIIVPLELRVRAEVPLGGYSSGGVRNEIMLAEDQRRGNDGGEGCDELLDRGIPCTSVPGLKQLVLHSR